MAGSEGVRRICGVSMLMADAKKYILPDTARFHAYCQQLSRGGLVNQSEHRAATHTQFREAHPNAIVSHALAQVKSMSEAIRHQQFSFHVADVVNIGIGGSDLGPKLICEAFEDTKIRPRLHFVSNLDP